jgi:hypothetical protein
VRSKRIWPEDVLSPVNEGASNPESAGTQEGERIGGTRAAKAKEKELMLQSKRVKAAESLVVEMKLNRQATIASMNDRTTMLMMLQDPTSPECQEYLALKRQMALIELKQKNSK